MRRKKENKWMMGYGGKMKGRTNAIVDTTGAVRFLFVEFITPHE